MQAELEFNIIASNYAATVVELSPRFYQLRRKDVYSERAHVIDCLGSTWMLAFFDGPAGKVFVRTPEGFFSPNTPTALLMPPFTLVEYLIEPGSIQWEGVVSVGEISPDLPESPILFDWDFAAPKTLEQTYQFIRERKNQRVIPSERKPSSLAAKAKAYIDKNFTEELRINDLADHLKVSRVVLSREFSKVYGLSPVRYRHRLRIFETLRWMNEGYNITDSLYRGGFTDASEFLHQFKRTLHTKPSSYRTPKSVARKSHGNFSPDL